LFVPKIKAKSDGGIMVSIAAFQAVDPGSIPGHRIFFLLLVIDVCIWNQTKTNLERTSFSHYETPIKIKGFEEPDFYCCRKTYLCIQTKQNFNLCIRLP
jgi:hypothetical protein